MRRIPIAALDALALTSFVLAGIAEHDDGTDISTLFLRNIVPLLVSWFVVARLVGTYRRPGLRSMFVTWAIAVPCGLLLRTAWVGSPHGAEILVFLGVGMAFTLLFLLVGRGAARVLAGGGAPTTPGVVR